MEDGVWRTVAGRRIFIKEGQSLSDAMKNSGKFKLEKKDVKGTLKKQFDKEIDITKDERELLDYAVKEAGIMEYNDIMRHNYEDVPDKLYKDMDKLDDLISKNKIKEDMELYRYITDKEVFSNLKEGDIYTDKAFMSTTKNPNSDRESDFKNSYDSYNVKMVIKSKSGDNAFDISGIYDKLAYKGEEESEVLFGRNTKLKLTKKETILDPLEKRIPLSKATEKEIKLYDNQYNQKKYVYYFEIEKDNTSKTSVRPKDIKKNFSNLSRKELATKLVEEQIKRGIVKPENKQKQILSRLNGSAKMSKEQLVNYAEKYL